MIPTSRLIWLVAMGLLLFALGISIPAANGLGLVLDGALVALFLGDHFLSRGQGSLAVRRDLPTLLSVGVDNEIGLVVTNQGAREVQVVLRESLPAMCLPDRVTVHLKVPGGVTRIGRYQTRPTRRGEYRLLPLALRRLSRLGFFWYQTVLPLKGRLRIYPDVTRLQELELAVRRDRTAELGLHRLRAFGGGTEFESLREYGPDDEFRRIDWQATARHGRAIVRQYQLERSQTVMIMFDTGRTMTREFQGLSRLDHAIHAALLLALAASMRGDRVGMLSFGAQGTRYIPPVAGAAVLPALMAGVFDLEASLDEPDYPSAFNLLAVRCRKRALIVLFSEVTSMEVSEELVRYMQTLRTRHIPLLVCIQDGSLVECANALAKSERAVLEKAAAVTLLEERANALQHLSAGGVMVVDAPSAGISLSLVNRYLALKSRLRL